MYAYLKLVQQLKSDLDAKNLAHKNYQKEFSSKLACSYQVIIPNEPDVKLSVDALQDRHAITVKDQQLLMVAYLEAIELINAQVKLISEIDDQKIDYRQKLIDFRRNVYIDIMHGIIGCWIILAIGSPIAAFLGVPFVVIVVPFIMISFIVVVLLTCLGELHSSAENL